MFHFLDFLFVSCCYPYVVQTLFLLYHLGHVRLLSSSLSSKCFVSCYLRNMDAVHIMNVYWLGTLAESKEVKHHIIEYKFSSTKFFRGSCDHLVKSTYCLFGG